MSNFKKHQEVSPTKEHIAHQARKALFNLCRKIRVLELPIDCPLKMFDNTIIPIITHGCEVWV